MAKPEWRVYAVDGHTNEVIASKLGEDQRNEKVLCQDGERRDLWQCDWPFVERLRANRRDLQLDFMVFKRTTPNGPLVLWKSPKEKKVSLKQALKAGLVKTAA